jgi:alpha-beta hydrolase superfamily lysophospholipase
MTRRHSLRSLAAAALLAVVPVVVATPAHSQRILERRAVRVDGHPLSVWSKRPPTAAAGSILLLHGRTWSSRPNFDLRDPGSGVNRSLMDALVARGYAVYALDQRGYGGTPRDGSGWLTPDRAARDVSAVLEWVREREADGRASRARPRLPVLLGYSLGAQLAMLVAQRNPERMSGLVLYGFPVPDPEELAAIVDPRVPPRQRTTALAAGEDFISPALTPPGVKEAYVRMATTMDSIRVDWRAESQLSALDPARVRVPTLLLHGGRDPYVDASRYAAFFSRLGTADKRRVVLPAASHVAHLEVQDAFVNALVSFMERR